jgi:hypothetical protein
MRLHLQSYLKSIYPRKLVSDFIPEIFYATLNKIGRNISSEMPRMYPKSQMIKRSKTNSLEFTHNARLQKWL